MRHRSAGLLLFLLVSTALAAPPARPVPATQPDPTRWAALLQRLAAPDFAMRQAAQLELEQFDGRQLDFLRHAAATAADPEIKARLATGIAAIEENLNVYPPPISLNIKSIPLPQVAGQLAKSLGVTIDSKPDPSHPDVPARLFTLDALDKPFWDVFFDLSRQQPLLLYQDSEERTVLSPFDRGTLNFATVAGPLALRPDSLLRQRTTSFQNPGGFVKTPETLALVVGLTLDPRLRVLKYSKPVFTEITDNAGHTFLRQPGPPAPSEDASRQFPFACGAGATFAIPDTHGAQIASAKGALRVLLQTAEERLDIPEFEKKSGQNITFAGRTLHVAEFDLISPGGGGFVVSAALEIVRAPAASPFPLSVTLVDGTGKVVFSRSESSTMHFSDPNTFQPPFALHLSIPVKTKDVTYPFELKDLPIP